MLYISIYKYIYLCIIYKNTFNYYYFMKHNLFALSKESFTTTLVN